MQRLQKEMMVIKENFINNLTPPDDCILYFLFTPNGAVAIILQNYLTATGKSLISIFKIRVMASQKVNVELQKKDYAKFQCFAYRSNLYSCL